MLGCLRIEVAAAAATSSSSSSSSSLSRGVDSVTESESEIDRREGRREGEREGRREGEREREGGRGGESERRIESQVGKINAGHIQEEKVTDRIHGILKSGKASDSHKYTRMHANKHTAMT